MKINLGKKEIIHFIGIGGIGMSGLALIMNQLGFKIQGSDISINKNIERLKKSKIKIFTKHKISNLNKANIVVISSAIKNNNIELKAAKKKYCCGRFTWKNYYNFINCKCFFKSKIRSYNNKWRCDKFN